MASLHHQICFGVSVLLFCAHKRNILLIGLVAAKGRHERTGLSLINDLFTVCGSHRNA